MKGPLTALAVVSLGACNPAPPRDAAWFERHPAEAEKVVSQCEAGARSKECEPARTALSRIAAQRRMERYRKGFQ